VYFVFHASFSKGQGAVREKFALVRYVDRIFDAKLATKRQVVLIFKLVNHVSMPVTLGAWSPCFVYLLPDNVSETHLWPAVIAQHLNIFQPINCTNLSLVGIYRQNKRSTIFK
jgi:hypothetical protein